LKAAGLALLQGLFLLAAGSFQDLQTGGYGYTNMRGQHCLVEPSF
jgi:hypothetical protein